MLFYVYWTVHHLDSWVKRDQLDVTCFIISLFNVQHVSDVNTSILSSLRLICWIISWVVLLWFDVCWCYVVVWLWWCGIRMQAEALVPYWDWGFESHQAHICLSLWLLCFVSATRRSLLRRSPTGEWCVCALSRYLNSETAWARVGLLRHRKKSSHEPTGRRKRRTF